MISGERGFWGLAADIWAAGDGAGAPERSDLRAFVRSAWPIIEPETELKWNWHLDELVGLLGSITQGDVKRVIINIPPGTMKSLLVSVLWPAWEWASAPGGRYLTASYSDANTIRDNRSVREIVNSEWYQGISELRLASDQAAKVRLDTTARGWRIATSVGGRGTGEHPDRIIIDDPIKAQGARSPADLAECREWYDRTIATRVKRDPAMVLIMQRLHEEDLAGHLMAKGGWERVCLPMRYEAEREGDPDYQPDPRDHRTEPGELLWPEAYPEDAVRRMELDLGPYGAAGQLQQNPVPEGGGLFKREWFEFVDAAPADARRCRGWDTAGTESGGDWTVGVKLAERGGTWYVEDATRGQWGPAGVDAAIRQAAESDGKRCKVREEKEGGSAGKAVVSARARALAGWDYAGVPITGDKVTRAGPFRSQCEAGNVRIVRGPWNNAYLDVLCAFPVGKFDDDVDATSCAFNAMVAEPRHHVAKVKLTVDRHRGRTRSPIKSWERRR